MNRKYVIVPVVLLLSTSFVRAQPERAKLLEFFETMTELYDELRNLPIGALRSVARMRGKVRKLLGPLSGDKGGTK